MEFKHLIHSIVQHYHNHDIHEVVAYQDSGKQSFGLLKKMLYTIALALILNAVDIFFCEGEISYLGARVERREHESNKCCCYGQPATQIGSIK